MIRYGQGHCSRAGMHAQTLCRWRFDRGDSRLLNQAFENPFTSKANAGRRNDLEALVAETFRPTVAELESRVKEVGLRRSCAAIVISMLL